MKIDFTQNLLGFDGNPIMEPDNTPWTLQKAAMASLTNALPGDETASPMEKVQIGLIGVAIHEGKEITTGDAQKLKERICRILPAPVIAWAVENAIEGKTEA